METITKLDTLNTLAIDRELLNDLLTGALVAADKSKGAITKLGSVYLSISDGKITANASDRYRLVSGSADISSPDMQEIQILVADVKRILTLIKDNKMAGEITLTRAGDTLSVAAAGNSLVINLMGDKFPPIDNLISRSTAKISGLSLNVDRIGSFNKVPSSRDGQIYLDFTTTDQGTPTQIKIGIPHDKIEWRCLLMPMRDDR